MSIVSGPCETTFQVVELEAPNPGAGVKKGNTSAASFCKAVMM